MLHPNIFGYSFGTLCGIRIYSDIRSCPFYDIRSSLGVVLFRAELIPSVRLQRFPPWGSIPTRQQFCPLVADMDFINALGCFYGWEFNLKDVVLRRVISQPPAKAGWEVGMMRDTLELRRPRTRSCRGTIRRLAQTSPRSPCPR